MATTTNQSKITTNNNNNSFCLAGDFVPSSSFILPSLSAIKQSKVNKMNNNIIRRKYREHIFDNNVKLNTNNDLLLQKKCIYPLEQSSKNEIISSSIFNQMASKNKNIIPIFQFNYFNLISFNLINKLFFIFLLLFIFSSSSQATPILSDIQQKKIIFIPVGSIFIFEENLSNELSPRQQLPIWMHVNLIGENKKRFFGIPQMRDVGKYKLSFQDGRKIILLEVSESQPSPCPIGISTIWLEIIDSREFNRLSIDEQLKLSDSFISNLHKSDLSTFVHRENFRIFPLNYLERYRIISEEILKAPIIPNSSFTSLILNISCGELSEQGSEVISLIADQGYVFRVVEGFLTKPKEEIEQKLKEKEDEENKLNENNEKSSSSSSSSFLIIGIILFLIFIIIIIFIILKWFRAKQQEKRRKQFLDSKGNGTSSTRPSALNNNNNNNPNSILSPDSSMKTLTTPMLECNENSLTAEGKQINGN